MNARRASSWRGSWAKPTGSRPAVPSPRNSRSRPAGFRPEAATLAADGIAATVRRTIYLGNRTELQVETAAGEKLTLLSRDARAVGDTVKFQLRREDLTVF